MKISFCYYKILGKLLFIKILFYASFLSAILLFSFKYKKKSAYWFVFKILFVTSNISDEYEH